MKIAPTVHSLAVSPAKGAISAKSVIAAIQEAGVLRVLRLHAVAVYARGSNCQQTSLPLAPGVIATQHVTDKKIHRSIRLISATSTAMELELVCRNTILGAS